MSQTEARNEQYAVIQARWVGRPAECFPVTYEDEEELRAILAGSSILACGIASREQALAVAQDTFSVARSTAHLPDTVVCESVKFGHDRGSTTPREGKFSLERICKTLSELTGRLAAAAILVICSKNVFCGLLRAFIGV